MDFSQEAGGYGLSPILGNHLYQFFAQLKVHLPWKRRLRDIRVQCFINSILQIKEWRDGGVKYFVKDHKAST